MADKNKRSKGKSHSDSWGTSLPRHLLLHFWSFSGAQELGRIQAVCTGWELKDKKDEERLFFGFTKSEFDGIPDVAEIGLDPATTTSKQRYLALERVKRSWEHFHPRISEVKLSVDGGISPDPLVPIPCRKQFVFQSGDCYFELHDVSSGFDHLVTETEDLYLMDIFHHVAPDRIFFSNGDTNDTFYSMDLPNLDSVRKYTHNEWRTLDWDGKTLATCDDRTIYIWDHKLEPKVQSKVMLKEILSKRVYDPEHWVDNCYLYINTDVGWVVLLHDSLSTTRTHVQMFALDSGQELHDVKFEYTESLGAIIESKYIRSRKQVVLQRQSSMLQLVSLTTESGSPEFHQPFGTRQDEKLLGVTILHILALSSSQKRLSLYSFRGEQLASIALELQPALSALLCNPNLMPVHNNSMMMTILVYLSDGRSLYNPKTVQLLHFM